MSLNYILEVFSFKKTNLSVQGAIWHNQSNLIKCFPKKLKHDNLDSAHSQDDQDSNIPGSLDHAYVVAYCSSIGVRIIRAVSSC